MAVYVDDLAYLKNGRLWYHMAADTLDALHGMADNIGLERRWFQNKNPKFPHYDITESKRRLALQHGAIAITGREMVMWNRDRLDKELL